MRLSCPASISAILNLKIFLYTTVMAGEIFKRLLESPDKAADTVPDNRHGQNTKHGMRDAVKSALGVFFFQFPSFLKIHDGNAKQAQKKQRAKYAQA